MNLLQTWIKALRSDKYKQGRGLLRDKHDQYCCLGVLCDLIDPEAWTYFEGDVTWEDPISGTHRTGTILPETMQKVFPGLPAPNAEALASALIAQNDNGKSFEQIADYLENR